MYFDDFNNGLAHVAGKYSSGSKGYVIEKTANENKLSFWVGDGSDDIEVKTGTVVFFNGYLLHRSRKNRGQTYRRVLVNHYCNAWSLLPWSIKDDERPANADRRSFIPVSGIDPYAWKGYEETSNNIYFRHCKAVEDLEKSTMNNKEMASLYTYQKA